MVITRSYRKQSHQSHQSHQAYIPRSYDRDGIDMANRYSIGAYCTYGDREIHATFFCETRAEAEKEAKRLAREKLPGFDRAVSEGSLATWWYAIKIVED